MPLSSSNSDGCTYRFIKSSLSTLPVQTNYDLEIRQQPERAKISLINERDRRYIEPPPILQLYWHNCSKQELKKCLQSPFYFTVANLVTEEDPETLLLPVQDYMSGSTVSSLYRLRDMDNSDGGFFVFGDLAVKRKGKFKLKFSLFEIVEGQVENKRTILSDTFTVFLPKQFPGPVEATFLSRTFSDQGVKMRIRKEHRLLSRKRKLATNEKCLVNQHSKMVIPASPSYAEPSASSLDVFFGRWQATTVCSKAPSTPSAGTTMVAQDKRLPGKFKYQCPSPETTVYNNPIPTTMSYRYAVHSQSVPRVLTTPNTERSSPELMTTTGHFTDSMAKQLPQDPSLERYHTCSDTKSSRDNRLHSLPIPPSSITDLHQNATGAQSWGTRLPPLKAIMDNLDPHMNKSSFLLPLLLPPPPPLVVTINASSSSMNNQQDYPSYYR